MSILFTRQRHQFPLGFCTVLESERFMPGVISAISLIHVGLDYTTIQCSLPLLEYFPETLLLLREKSKRALSLKYKHEVIKEITCTLD